LKRKNATLAVVSQTEGSSNFQTGKMHIVKTESRGALPRDRDNVQNLENIYNWHKRYFVIFSYSIRTKHRVNIKLSNLWISRNQSSKKKFCKNSRQNLPDVFSWEKY